MTDLTLIQRAILAATQAHIRDTRIGSGDPYIIHPIRVAGFVRKAGGSEITIAAAYLHDVIEDHPEFDLSGFPEEVLALVRAVSHDGANKEDAIKKLRSNKDALFIKIADRYDNVSDGSSYSLKYLAKPIVQASTRLLMTYAEEIGLGNLEICLRLKALLERVR